MVISDTLPAALTGASISTALDSGVSITQTGSAPNLAWDVSPLGVGKGGVITITTALKNDTSLLGTSFKNTAIITATGDITPNNNESSVISQVIAPDKVYLPVVLKK